MSIKIGQYTFEGPYPDTSPIRDNAGVYVVLCKNGSNSIVIDVGESATVKTRLETHDREDCWKQNCRYDLNYAVYYTPYTQQPGRITIEKELRKQFNPPCGER